MKNDAQSPWPVGDSEMARRVREHDWASTPLGPIGTWPQSLRTAVDLCLASNFPINIIWGSAHTQIYNDGYRDCCGDAHPRALGEDYRVTWASAWPAIGQSFERAFAGETMYLENQRMFLNRLGGALEETFFTFSHSPIRAEGGGVGGLFHPVTETTATMLAERRTRALRDLSASLSLAEDEDEVAQRAADVLSRFAFDLPVLLLYRVDSGGHHYRLAAHLGLRPGLPASPTVVSAEESHPWPFAEAFRTSRMVEVDRVSIFPDAEPCGPYPEAPNRVFVLPIIVPGTDTPPMVVLAAASPRLPVNEAYRSFAELLGVTLSNALATVRARADERRRAEALAEIDRAKTAFFSNVSHEFRTPLTLMLGPLDELLTRPDGLDPAAAERIVLARRNAQRMLKLVNTLLDFSRIEAGRTEASYEPTDLAGLTADLASNFRSATERAGLSLVVEADPLPEPVFVDRDMWEKIVLNLISNAFKFTQEGEIRVTVRRAADGEAAELEVRDTGIGIAAHELPHLFERFHRVEGARGRSFEGSGIGLALVQELVRLHGGTITVSSEGGRGSCFIVRLPFGARHLPPGRVGSEKALASTAIRADAYVEEALGWLFPAPGGERADIRPGDRHPGLGGRVLLAEDNADMRAYLERLLTGHGFAVEAVAHGGAALAAARHRPPDLILADVMMPGIDGLELLASVRADPELKDIPVVLLSARAGEEARAEGIEAGADDYVIKPFAPRELIARVSATLNLARERREALLRETQERQEFLLGLSDALRAIADPVAVQEAASRISAEHLDVGRVACWEIGYEPDLTLIIERDWPRRAMPPIPAGRYRMNDFGPFMAEELRAGRPAIVANAATDPRLSPAERGNWRAFEIAASCALPVMKEGRLVACLVAQDDRSRDWTDREIALLREVSERTWAAMERARAEAALRESERRLAAELSGTQLLQRLSTRLIPEQSPEVLHEQILAAALELMEADAVSIQLLDETGQRLRRLATLNLHPESTEYWTWVNASHASTCGQALRTNSRVVVEDVETSAELAGTGDLEAFRASGTRAVQSTPLVSRSGRPMGMISTHWRSPRRLTEEDFGLFDILARQVADLLERSQTEAALRASEERQAFLLRLSDALRPLADPVEVQAAAARALGEHLGVDRAFYCEVGPDEDHLVVHRDYTSAGTASFAGKWRLSDFVPFWEDGFRAGRTLATADVSEIDGANAAAFEANGFQAFVGAPVKKGGRLVGILVVHSAARREWNPLDIALVEETAERTWAAVERARTEAALRESEERLRAAFSISTVGVLFWGQGGSLKDANQAFLRMTGFSREEALGKTWQELTPPEFHAASAQFVEEVETTGEGTPYEKQYFRKDGSRWWGVFTARKLGDGFVEFVLDVTAQHEAQDALHQREEQLRLIVESARDYAIFTVDRERRVTHWMAGAEAVFGWTKEEMEGRSADILYTPEDLACGQPEKEIACALAEGKALDVRWHEHKDGRKVFIDGLVVPLKGGGAGQGFLKIGQDVTQRRAAEQALQESEERFRQFGEASSDLLWIRNAETLAFEYVSPAFTKLYGVAREQMLEGHDVKAWLELIHPDDREDAVAGLRSLRDGVPCNHEFRAVHPSGEIVWVHNTDFPILDDTGRVQRIAGIAQDVTERKRAVELQSMLLAELQHRVRNILAMMRSIIRRTIDEERTVEDYVQHLEGRVSALARTQVLLTRKPGSGVDLEELVRDELLAQAVSEDQLSISGPEVTLAPKAAEVVTLAIHELATNATKYGAFSRPEGRLKIDWDVSRRDSEGWLTLKWVESGVPIVSSSPMRRGFGAELISKRIPYELKGRGCFELRPGGLRSEIEFPLMRRESILQTDGVSR